MLYQELYEPLTVRGLTFPNRIAMGPMTVTQATADGHITDWLVDWYRCRAAGGTGVIISSATFVRKDGRGWRGLMGLDDDAQIPGMARVVAAAHDYGAVAGVQLFHVGAKVKAAVIGGQPVSASAVAIGDNDVPRALATEELAELVTAFAAAARRAEQAGCDFVEIHGAHGYLLDQFLKRATNERTDQYGGDITGRLRFALEVVRAVRAALDDATPLLYRFSIMQPDLDGEGMTRDELAAYLSGLQDAGVDMIDVSCIGGGYRTPVFGTEQPLLVHCRQLTELPLIVAGGVQHPAQAQQLLADGHCEMVALARALIADAAWAAKARDGAADTIVPASADAQRQLRQGFDPGC